MKKMRRGRRKEKKRRSGRKEMRKLILPYRVILDPPLPTT
jgi:hypothetical protein